MCGDRRYKKPVGLVGGKKQRENGNERSAHSYVSLASLSPQYSFCLQVVYEVMTDECCGIRTKFSRVLWLARLLLLTTAIHRSNINNYGRKEALFQLKIPVFRDRASISIERPCPER